MTETAKTAEQIVQGSQHLKEAVLAAVQKGATNDREAVSFYRDARDTIVAALPELRQHFEAELRTPGAQSDDQAGKYAAFAARQEHLRDPWRGIGAKCVCGRVFDCDTDHAMHQVEEILVAVQGDSGDDSPASGNHAVIDETALAEVNARVYDEAAVDSPEDYPLQYTEAMQYGRDTARAAVENRAAWLNDGALEYALRTEGEEGPWTSCYPSPESLMVRLGPLAARDDEEIVCRRVAGGWERFEPSVVSELFPGVQAALARLTIRGETS
ncbi:hypothetical protein [Leucobacter salsicius]|uniref:hypothetical protein n=1 Tax=Leucobacter salsicius TaxID=664638 RepID=UPI0003466093|nr:hypothetical protein [Leucobacter salsicius]